METSASYLWTTWANQSSLVVRGGRICGNVAFERIGAPLWSENADVKNELIMTELICKG